jgi:hypothetical protein
VNHADQRSPINLEKELWADVYKPSLSFDTLVHMHIELGCIFVEYVREFRALFGISFKESFSGEPLIGVEVKGVRA